MSHMYCQFHVSGKEMQTTVTDHFQPPEYTLLAPYSLALQTIPPWAYDVPIMHGSMFSFMSA